MLVDPQPYLQFNLIRNARAVITDSGGVTEEATARCPCLTLRDNAERPETVDIGTNVLVGTAPEALAAIAPLFEEGWKMGGVPSFGMVIATGLWRFLVALFWLLASGLT